MTELSIIEFYFVMFGSGLIFGLVLTFLFNFSHFE